MTVQVKVNSNRVETYTPFNYNFIDKAKNLGGKWDASKKAWCFDVRDEQRVRELCLEVYGDDGLPQDRVTLVVKMDSEFYEEKNVFVVGRPVVRVYGRDSGAKLEDDVVVLKGGFGSGGSRKNYCVTWKDDTVFEIRDVPQKAAERAVEKHPELVSIKQEKTDTQSTVDALRKEREELVKRIDEIDQEILNLV